MTVTEIPPGNYEWRLVHPQTLRSEFISVVGQNVDPSWEKATDIHHITCSLAFLRRK